MNSIKKLDQEIRKLRNQIRKYLFISFNINNEGAVNELETGKLNTDQNIHFRTVVGLPHEVNILLNL